MSGALGLTWLCTGIWDTMDLEREIRAWEKKKKSFFEEKNKFLSVFFAIPPHHPQNEIFIPIFHLPPNPYDVNAF
jgi:hypothetical protein